MSINSLGGGGGVQPDHVEILNLEIAVNQQTRAHDQTFKGVLDPERQLASAGPHNFWPLGENYPNINPTQILGALCCYVATDFLSSYTQLYWNWTTNGRVMSKTRIVDLCGRLYRTF